MKMLKKFLIIFIIAFVLNLIWEHFHSVLYVHYKGGEITSYILTRAAIFDAFMITFFVYFLKNIKYVVLIAVLFSIGLEIWAIEVGRWVYTDSMPTIFGVGLTPAIQLGLLAFLSMKILTIFVKEK